MQAESKKNTGILGYKIGYKTLLLISVAGLFISIAAWVYTNPLSPDSILGMPGWPPSLGRHALFYVWAFTFFLPVMYAMYLYYNQHQKWLVPRNEVYDSNKSYKVWTTRRVVEAAVASGFYLAMSMIKLPMFQQLDLMYLAGGFSAIFWGGPVTFVMAFVGGILRSVVGGFANAYDLVGNTIVDGFYWMILAVFWRKFVEEAKGARHVLGMVAAIIMVQIIFFVNWFIIVSSISWTWETYVPFVVTGAVLYAAVIFIGLPLGTIAADAAIRASKRR